MYIKLEEEYFAFLGHLPQHFWGGGKDELMRLAKRFKTPCSNRVEQLAEARAAIRSARAGTHYLADLPIYLGVFNILNHY